MSIAPVPANVSFLHPRPRGHSARARAHRHALDAALRKAAILERLDPRGDPYGAAGQALEDFVKREEQIVAGGEDVRGWISTVTERRWINELRYQGRRTYDRLDGPVSSDTTSTLGDLVAKPGLGLEDVVELREHVHSVVGEQRAALAHLRHQGVQPRHIRIVELALTSGLLHHEVARTVNREFPGSAAIAGNTVTQVIRRLRERLDDDDDRFPTVVARLRRTRSAA